MLSGNRHKLARERAAAVFALLAVAFMMPLCCIEIDALNEIVIVVEPVQAGENASAYTVIEHDHAAMGHDHSGDGPLTCNDEAGLSDSAHAYLQRVSSDTMHLVTVDGSAFALTPPIGEPLRASSDHDLPSLATAVDVPPPRSIV